MLKACLNGARRPDDHPALPAVAADVARDVVAVAAAGADAVHVHVKDDRGVDTLDGPTTDAVLSAVREAAPGMPVGVTTGAWALPDPEQRVAAVRSWAGLSVRPDFASVNWHEEGADQVAEALLDLGIGVEAGLWHADGVRAWLASPHRDRCLRVLLELPGGLTATAAEEEAERLLRMVDRPGEVLLHGEDETAWPVLRMAVRLDLAARIGLEDVLVLPDGRAAAGNAELVRAARQVSSGEPPVS